MVLLINLIPFFVFLAGCAAVYWTVKTKKPPRWSFGAAALSVFALFLYFKAQPSYMPKGDIKRTEIPALSAAPSAQIEDRNRQAMPQMERRARQEEQYREGPVFLKDGGQK